jgi:hypothetical protein
MAGNKNSVELRRLDSRWRLSVRDLLGAGIHNCLIRIFGLLSRQWLLSKTSLI